MEAAPITSPAKRPALAARDANAVLSPSPRAATATAKPLHTQKVTMMPLSPTRRENSHSPSLPSKRIFGVVEVQAASSPCKKPRLDVHVDEGRVSLSPVKTAALSDTSSQTLEAVEETRSRTASPDTSDTPVSCVFDNSLAADNDNDNDTSLATTAPTEAEASPLPIRPASTLSRQETRQRAETIRLRLGLASYKVRTGQTEVPLDRLQVRPFRPAATTTARPLVRTVPAVIVHEPEQSVGAAADEGEAVVKEESEEDLPARRHVEVEVEKAEGEEGCETGTVAPSPEKNLLPPVKLGAPGRGLLTPQRRRPAEELDELRLTSSAVRGEVASELLFLARGER